jgi:peptide/nickel transport system substrate-binding protein
LAAHALSREEAARNLDAAGWTDSDGDGVRDRDGVKLAVRLLVAADPTRENVATLLRENLAAVGIELETQILEMMASMRMAQEGDFDILLAGMRGPLIVAPAGYLGTGSRGNLGGYSNPALDAIMEEGMKAESREEAIPVWHRFQKMFHEEQPWTMLYYPDIVVGARRDVRGATPNFISPLHGVENWWLDTGAR